VNQDDTQAAIRAELDRLYKQALPQMERDFADYQRIRRLNEKENKNV